ncbi:MAG TPA: 4Fe-4S binding protein [Vicinamibacterales bacterium]|nr:4Fe-4S binding protein [Vicinamibacterales bacterium]
MNVPAEPQTPRRLDLLRASPRRGRLLRQRWFPLVIAFPLLMLTATFVTAGLLGTPVGNSNGLVIFVWILWWFVLMAVLVPFASRSWCGVCPVPLLGDWLQRRRVVGVVHADSRTSERTGLIGRNR